MDPTKLYTIKDWHPPYFICQRCLLLLSLRRRDDNNNDNYILLGSTWMGDTHEETNILTDSKQRRDRVMIGTISYR